MRKLHLVLVALLVASAPAYAYGSDLNGPNIKKKKKKGTYFITELNAGAAFGTAVQFMPLDKIGMTTNLSPWVCVQIFAAVVPFAVLGAGLMTFVASFTKSFREAQTYTSIAMVVPPLPIILVVLNPVQPSVPLMLVPSLSQHLLVTELVKGEAFDPLHLGISAATTIAVGVNSSPSTPSGPALDRIR